MDTIQIRVEHLKELIRDQYNYGYNRQIGNLAYRDFNRMIKVQFPFPKDSKERYNERRINSQPQGAGHPLAREAFIKGCKDGESKRYRPSIIAAIQNRISLRSLLKK